jgi:hypothetical protein
MHSLAVVDACVHIPTLWVEGVDYSVLYGHCFRIAFAISSVSCPLTLLCVKLHAAHVHL